MFPAVDDELGVPERFPKAGKVLLLQDLGDALVCQTHGTGLASTNQGELDALLFSRLMPNADRVAGDGYRRAFRQRGATLENDHAIVYAPGDFHAVIVERRRGRVNRRWEGTMRRRAAKQEGLHSPLKRGTVGQAFGLVGKPLRGVSVGQEFARFGIDQDFADPADHATRAT